MGFNISKSIGSLGGLLDAPADLTMKSTLNAGQEAVNQRLGSYLSSRVGKAMPSYTGGFVAPMSQYEQAGLNQLGQLTAGVGGYMPQRQSAYGSALAGNAVQGIDPKAQLAQYYQNVNPYWQNYFQNQLAPQVKEDLYAMGGGKSSSAMNRALAQAGTDVAGQMGMGAQQVYQQALDQQQQRDMYNAQARMQAAGSYEPMRQEMLSNIQAAMQYGALPRELAQAVLDTNFQEWLRTQPEYSPVISQALQYLGLSTTASYFTPNQGLLGKISTGTGQLRDIIGNIAGKSTSKDSEGNAQPNAGASFGSIFGGLLRG